MASVDTIHDLIDTRRGHFRFESGYHAGRWMELDPLFVSPDRVRPLATELAHLLQPFAPDAVCGPLVGGALVAQLVALELGCETYFAQRISTRDNSGLFSAEYRLPNSLRRRITGKRVAIVDDVISAGSSVRATFAELQARGARPVVVGSFLLMGEMATTWFAARGLGVEACACADIEMWLPDECPLCASGVPLEDVTVLDAGG
jgi:orotate phosphoribosyltransferase